MALIRAIKASNNAYFEVHRSLPPISELFISKDIKQTSKNDIKITISAVLAQLVPNALV